MFAPLALVVGGVAMLFNGLKMLFPNWRLDARSGPAGDVDLARDARPEGPRAARQVVHVLRGPVLIPIVLAIVAVTAGGFFLNAVFGFAIVQPGVPKVRPAFAKARSHLAVILGSGAVVGLLLGFATMVVTRWGRPWFGLSLSVVDRRDDGVLRRGARRG